MKKIALDLLKNLIIPMILIGILTFCITLLFVDQRHIFSDRHSLRLIIDIVIVMSVIFGPITYFLIWWNRHLQKSYIQMDIWSKEIEGIQDIITLESYVQILKNYRNSSKCPSGNHMRYANNIILAAKTKINTIKKIDNDRRSQ